MKLLLPASIGSQFLHLDRLIIRLVCCCLLASTVSAAEPEAKTGKKKKSPEAAAIAAAAKPIRLAHPEDVREKSLSGRYQFYLGTLHAHSGYSGDHAKTVATRFNDGVADYSRHQPAELFAKAAINFYDFYSVTDHSSPEQNEFYRNGFTDEHWESTRLQCAGATSPSFLALRGYEFSRNNDPDKGGLGHMNVFGTADWNSAYAPGHTFAWLYDWMAAQTNRVVLAQFNHPQLPGPAKAKNFNQYAGRTRQRNEVVRLAEIWNSTERLGYVPTVQKIWALGWKVAPTAGTDVHGPNGLEKRALRTGVLAEELSTEAVLRALHARRVYATLEPLLHFEFMLNGVEMGTALAQAPKEPLHARVFANDLGGSTLSRVEIYGGKYEQHGGGCEKACSVAIPAGGKICEGTVPSGYDYYYAVLFKAGVDTARAFSAPIWMDDN